ncbi:GumC family protein [Methylomarinum vadi]|uniref:GumC family protein n=1 Tax=Methylomarinum vadi TaxID=438855 RepID=UPI00056A7120|nr:hypothetical protein [Methylomarinum vadi]
MKQQRPQIEYLSQQDRYQAEPEERESSGFWSTTRLKIFVPTFVLTLLIGLIINYARPPVYQSTATLLTSAATAIDQVSSDVDFQNVAIQRQKLLSFELLTETLERLKEHGKIPQLSNLTVSDIRAMLTVKPVDQTNLLTMQAQGPDPELLPLVINTWIDVYLAAREASVESSTQNTVTIVENELSELDRKVEQAQLELDQFRKEHDISSTTREENEVLAKLQGLNRALNDANEAVVKAKARLDAVNLAIANGQAVVPEQEQRSLSSLERRYQELKEKLAEFDKRYTREYLALQPSLKYIPEQIKKLEAEIQRKKQEGKNIVWTQASQDYYAAKQVVSDIKQQLDEHKQKAADFTTLFAKHQKLIDDLTALEEIQRETRDRLVKIESKQYEKYPQVDVVERASVNRQVVSPDYDLGALVSLAAALLFAFFSVWLTEFLNKDNAEHQQFIFPVQAWFGNVNRPEHLENRQQEKVIEEQSQGILSRMPRYQKLSDDQITQLLRNAERDSELLILLLLSGLAIDEIIGLGVDRIDFNQAEISVDSESPRVIPIGHHVLDILIPTQNSETIWRQQTQLFIDDVRAMLYCVLTDSGLEGVDSLESALRQTYIIYLVEQGLRLTVLPKIVGKLSATELAGYAEFSPPGEGLTREQVQLVHPLCAGQ